MQRSTHPYASSQPKMAANSSKAYVSYSGPTLHTSIMPPIGALPPKHPQPTAPARKTTAATAETSPPSKRGLLTTTLAILEGRQQLSIPIEVQVIFSFPIYLPFFSMMALLSVASVVSTYLQQYTWPVDPLRAAIAGGCCGFLLRFLFSSYSTRIAWLSSAKFGRFVLAALLPLSFVGGTPFFISFACASCAVIAPKPKQSIKQI